MLIDTTNLVPYALLFLRIVIGIIFFSSGKSHAQHPAERSKSIGMTPITTSILGIAEIIGAISIAFGIFTQIGALILMMTMVGALYKKIALWNTKFYEDKGYGWHYDVLLLLGLLVIFATSGGYLTIFY
ncbi:putative oxidoreductase [Gelidibacter algens]|uniref:Putative oxidoreductase n=1 Tax=Gelidibacter algens TaxID=49280 RepID=A0A1A7QXN6_9FLAO|nr:DoxX family protein [Gelidibacter algens]OBX24775.1 hypothetical protein A9996_13350 [Gelidibacter algens]RAJ26753.1 putative oxidoreductase [Gelidibacter algens]